MHEHCKQAPERAWDHQSYHTFAAFSSRRSFFSSFRSVLRSVLSAPAPGFLPVFFLRLSLQHEHDAKVGIGRNMHQMAAVQKAAAQQRSCVPGRLA
jgi:hypothetical protein